MKILKNEVVREMTNEEEQLYLSRTFEDFFVENPEPTSEERIAVLEETTDDMILLMAELIGGN